MFKETPHTHFGVAWSRLQSGKFLPTGTASFPTKCSQPARNTWPADHVLLLPRLGGASMSPAHKALVAGRLLFTVSLGAFIVSFTKDRNQRRAQPSPTLDANTSFGWALWILPRSRSFYGLAAPGLAVLGGSWLGFVSWRHLAWRLLAGHRDGWRLLAVLFRDSEFDLYEHMLFHTHVCFSNSSLVSLNFYSTVYCFCGVPSKTSKLPTVSASLKHRTRNICIFHNFNCLCISCSWREFLLSYVLQTTGFATTAIHIHFSLCSIH